MTTLRAGSATDVGRVREINEDRVLVTDRLFAVADGVGGHQAGEVASQTAVETLRDAFKEPTTDALVGAVEAANALVWRLAQDNPDKRGMGTTLTAAALVQDDGDDQLAVVNVGDSRAYLLQRGELMQISEDHSLVEELVRGGRLSPEEAMVHPQRSVITRALGLDPEVEVDSWQLVPYRGDRVLLCSDGLTNELGDDRIASVLRQVRDPEEAAQQLVAQARDHGGSDNISVVVVDVVDDGGRAEEASAALAQATQPVASSRAPTRPVPPLDEGSTGPAGARSTPATGTAVAAPPPPTAGPAGDRRFTWRAALFFTALFGVLIAAVGAVAWYARSTYFVGLENDRIAIYKGRPGGVLWFRPTLVERKPLTVNDVLPAHLPDLRAGQQEPTKADADRYVNSLRQEAEQAKATAPGPNTVPPGLTPGPPPSAQP